jgi:glycosyltransferase involved in cell wall biosynthesis
VIVTTEAKTATAGVDSRDQAKANAAIVGHVIMLSYSFPPDELVGARRPYHFARYLGRYGYSTEVIAGPHIGKLEGWSNLRRVPEASGSKQVLRWAERFFGLAQRYLLPYECQLRWVPSAFSAAKAALGRNPGACVFSTSPPVAAHIAALWLHALYGIRWIADCRDPLAGNPFHDSFRARAFDTVLERLVIKHADLVIANTDTAQNELQRRYPQSRHKIQLLWNGYDLEETVAPAQIVTRDQKVIGHFGSIYGGRHPGLVVGALRRLIQGGLIAPKDFRFRLVGSIELDQPWVADPAFADLCNWGCLEYTNRVVPRADAQRQMAEADYLLLIDLNKQSLSVQVPAKLFEYIQIGRPILALTSKNSPVERILAGCGVPHVCIYPTEGSEEVDCKVMELFSIPVLPVRPSQSFSQQFDAVERTRTLAGFLRC